MALVKEIWDWAKEQYGFMPKTCWIAHVKELYGICAQLVWNRWGDDEKIY